MSQTSDFFSYEPLLLYKSELGFGQARPAV
jgi:hypothetical protein